MQEQFIIFLRRKIYNNAQGDRYRDMSAKTGINASRLWRLANKKTVSVKLSDVEKVAKAFNIPVQDIFKVEASAPMRLVDAV